MDKRGFIHTFFPLFYGLIVIGLFNVYPFFSNPPWSSFHIVPDTTTLYILLVLYCVSQFLLYLFIFLYIGILLDVDMNFIRRNRLWGVLKYSFILALPTFIMVVVSVLGEAGLPLAFIALALSAFISIIVFPVLIMYMPFYMCTYSRKQSWSRFKAFYFLGTKKKFILTYVYILAILLFHHVFRIIDYMLWPILPEKQWIYVYFRGWHPDAIRAINSADSPDDISVPVPSWGSVSAYIALIYLSAVVSWPLKRGVIECETRID